MLIAIYNFEPKFCPNCGRAAAHVKEPKGSINVKLRHSYCCICGVCYEMANAESILEATKSSEGDMAEKVIELRPLKTLNKQT